jgi:hypothetical protein
LGDGGLRLAVCRLSDFNLWKYVIMGEYVCIVLRDHTEILTKRLQRGAKVAVHPFWMRTLAMFCLLLVGAASVAQAAHIHGKWLPERASKASSPADASQVPGGEEHCSLCVAMHSALPVTERVEPVRLVLVDCVLAQTVVCAPEQRWHFAMFSRPPPAGKDA